MSNGEFEEEKGHNSRSIEATSKRTDRSVMQIPISKINLNTNKLMGNYQASQTG
jgi:hypothetical protein